MIQDPNKKGTLGEVSVIKDLCKKGYTVFQAVGNNSRVDIIVLFDGSAIKIQVKSTYSKRGVVTVYTRKTCLNPEYNYTYSVDDVDIFAIYVIDRDIVCYISSREILTSRTMFKLRTEMARNGQKKGVRYVVDYFSFEEALRGHTPNIRTGYAEDDEMVQTATSFLTAASES